MPRTIISLSTRRVQNKPDTVLVTITEPLGVPDFEISHDFNLDPNSVQISDLKNISSSNTQPIANDLLTTVSDQMRQALEIHPGVKHAIDQALNNTERNPICIHATASASQTIPWELLYDTNKGFLCLDRRWPIVRFCGNSSAPQTLQWDQKLKVVLVLAAAGRDPIPEWNAFFKALSDSGIPYSLHVLLSQDELRNQIETLGDADITCEWVPEDGEELSDRLTELAPQILHFFCHGLSDSGGSLEISRRGAHGIVPDPVFIGASHILSANVNLCLVTLNACEGGQAALEVHSLAYDLVLGGIPSAIGMRETIDALDAHEFCHSFYKEALSWLNNELDQKQEVILDWSSMLRKARVRLSNRNGGAGTAQQKALHFKNWSLPILFQQPHAAIMAVDKSNSLNSEELEDLISEIDTLRKARSRLPSNTPPEFIENINELIANLNQMLADNSQ